MQATYGKADLHMHTVYSDGHSTPAELVQYVVQRTDLDVIAITDHDAIAGAYEAQRCAEGTRLQVILGEEISTREGHVLAYFIHERIRPGMSASDTIAAIHEQGGIAVAAHPYDWMVRSLGHHGLLKRAAGRTPEWRFDGIETMNASLRPRSANMRAASAAMLLGLPAIGGSDSHLIDTIGYGYTLYAGQSSYDVRQAMLSGTTRVAGRHWSMSDMAIAGGKLVQKLLVTAASRSVATMWARG